MIIAPPGHVLPCTAFSGGCFAASYGQGSRGFEVPATQDQGIVSKWLFKQGVGGHPSFGSQAAILGN